MSFTLTNQEANVEAKITALTGSEPIEDLLVLKKATNGLAISNIATLDGYIQNWVDNASTSEDAENLMLATIAMAPSTLINRTTHLETPTGTGNVNVPANCNLVLVSGGGAGGAGGTGASFGSTKKGGGGGGAGAYVTEYPMPVNAGGTVSVTYGVSGGDTLIGNLRIGGGKAGTNASNPTDPNPIYQGKGGEGGKVWYLGSLVSEDGTVAYGQDGQDGNLTGATSGQYGGNGADSYGGAGGLGETETAFATNGSMFGAGGGGTVSSPKSGSGRTDVQLLFIIETVV
jgi:hypothetical protein